MSEMEITKHAYSKAKERLSWKRSTLDRMVGKIYLSGTKVEDTRGQMLKFLNVKIERYPEARELRVYGDILYIFSRGRLVTLYPIPSELIKYVKFNKTKKK